MRLVVEALSDYWRVYFYEPEGFRKYFILSNGWISMPQNSPLWISLPLLFSALAKVLKPAVIAEMLVWEPD